MVSCPVMLLVSVLLLRKENWVPAATQELNAFRLQLSLICVVRDEVAWLIPVFSCFAQLNTA